MHENSRNALVNSYICMFKFTRSSSHTSGVIFVKMLCPGWKELELTDNLDVCASEKGGGGGGMG